MTIPREPTAHERRRMKTAWPDTDVSVKQLCNEFGTSARVVDRWARKLGLGRKGLPPAVWTEERFQTALSLWKDGVPGSRIAEKLGLTRNAVLGKLSREGFMKLNGPSAPVKKLKATAPPPEPRKRVTIPNLPKPIPLPPPRKVPTTAAAKPWTQRRRGECNWIVDDDGVEAIACCAPVLKQGWCAEHCRIGLNPTPKTWQLIRSVRRATAA
jgi:GcrA cell cycle regulator